MRALLAAILIPGLLLLPNRAKAEEIPAQAAYLIEANTGRVIAAQNEHARLPMASTTKIMTALLAIESERLDETVTVVPEAEGTEGSSLYLKAGETLKLIDLVYGLMLRSGNDAAVAIACFLDGSVEAFVERMNEKAGALSLADTHFANPNGLHDAAHYTSAHDLCLLAAAALDDPVFSRIVKTQYYESHGDTLRTWKNKNRLLWEYEGGVGVKTGYTKAAGKCLAFAAERGDMKLVGAVLNCPAMWDTAKAMLDDGFARFETRIFADRRTEWIIPVKNGAKKALSAVPISCILYTVEIGRDESFDVEVSLLPALEAPVHAGDAVGTATLLLDGRAVRSVPIVAAESVDTVGFPEIFRKAVLCYHG